MARELGMPVGVMLATMSSYELTEWIAYFNLEAKEQRQAELGRRAESNRKQAGQQLRNKRNG